MINSKQEFGLSKMEALVALGVECNIIGLEHYFHNPEGKIILLDVGSTSTIGGGISFEVYTSNPKNKSLTDMCFVGDRPWTSHCKPHHGIGWGTHEDSKLKDLSKLAAWVAECCPDLGMTLAGRVRG